MGRDRSHPIDPRTAEGLLRDGADGHPRLSQVLAAAAAPPSEAELRGEQDAVYAFRRARLAEPATARHRSARAVWARLVTVKVAALALAIAAAGVAVAAGTGVLPNPLRAPIASPASTTTSSGPSPATGRRPRPSATTAPAPTAELVGLCRAYQAHVAAKPATPWPNPGLAALIQAAGGAEHIADFCAALGEPGPTAAPTKEPGKPADHPTGPPSPHPGNPSPGPTARPGH